MLNARRFDERITIGGVPTDDDLAQLEELGYKTLVDVRGEDEKFGGRVKARAVQLGLQVVEVPVNREAIKMEDVERFYFAVFERGSAPLYVFSRLGKKPLAFLLLLEAVAHGQPVNRIFRRASAFGLSLEGDQWLQEFLVRLMNSGEIQPIVDAIVKLRPELLLEQEGLVRARPGEPVAVPDPVGEALAQARWDWLATRDAAVLRKQLGDLVEQLAKE